MEPLRQWLMAATGDRIVKKVSKGTQVLLSEQYQAAGVDDIRRIIR